MKPYHASTARHPTGGISSTADSDDLHNLYNRKKYHMRPLPRLLLARFRKYDSRLGGCGSADSDTLVDYVALHLTKGEYPLHPREDTMERDVTGDKPIRPRGVTRQLLKDLPGHVGILLPMKR